MAVSTILAAAMLGFCLFTAIFAACFGKRAERIGAAIYVVSLVATVVAQGASDKAPLYAFLLIDLASSVAFGALALHYPEKLWPGVAGCAAFFVFIFSATRALEYPLSEYAYLVALNLAGLIVKGSLVAGTWAARWRKAPIDPWEEYAATLASLPPPSPIPPRAALTLT